MNIKQETAEKILLEDGGRFYALYNVYSRELKLIDSFEDSQTILESQIKPKEAFRKLDQMDEDDFARCFQRGQSKLFLVDGDQP